MAAALTRSILTFCMLMDRDFKAPAAGEEVIDFYMNITKCYKNTEKMAGVILNEAGDHQQRQRHHQGP